MSTVSTSTPKFDPYPNETSFRLGDWFWSTGGQKSQESFRDLIEIIRVESFKPSDVREANWLNINAHLGLNDWDKSNEEWEDEDAGWQVSSVSIQVPFHWYTSNPGVCDFVVKSFYRRSLTAVIREKLTLKKQDIHQFHIDPHELYWQCSKDQEPVRLYGEIYTSSSFMSAHQALQSSPPEPGCSLPHFVAAIMLWSDATHLTDFGTAHLTPLYLYFGNESKYQCCQPTSYLAEHVAYFEDCKRLRLYEYSFSYNALLWEPTLSVALTEELESTLHTLPPEHTLKASIPLLPTTLTNHLFSPHHYSPPTVGSLQQLVTCPDQGTIVTSFSPHIPLPLLLSPSPNLYHGSYPLRSTPTSSTSPQQEQPPATAEDMMAFITSLQASQKHLEEQLQLANQRLQQQADWIPLQDHPLVTHSTMRTTTSTSTTFPALTATSHSKKT
ncbi:hypothetical protein DXG01_001350 [Tephrocybe rancida]|nr:hypothetical protein DXG01_001350 [Tephrocybe rancida]